MAVDSTKVNAFVQALLDKFENKIANKKNDISGDFSTDSVSYPTAQAVKNWVTTTLGSYASSSHTHGNVSNDGKIGTASGKIVTTGTGGALQASDSITKSQISDFPSTMTPTSHTHGNLTNTGAIGSAANKPIITTTSGKLTTGSFGTSANSFCEGNDSRLSDARTPTSHSHGNLTNDGKVGTTSGKPLITGTGGAVQAGSFGTTSGTFAEGNHTHSQYLTQHQSLSSTEVTVVEQSTADTGFAKTYVVQQNGSQVGSKINIPKDFLVKSGQVKTVSTANTPVSGYTVGDKYIDFVINAKDNSGTDEHMYILVSDLVEDTTYTADNSTLQLSNGQFSVKNGGITKTKLATAVQTSLGYADSWNSSPAKGITSTQISNWDTAVAGGLTVSDVDNEIEAYLDAITTALS